MDLNKSINVFDDDINLFNARQINDVIHSSNQSFSSLSSVKKYILEWTEISRYLCSEPNLEKLRKSAIIGDLKISKFRSICWSLFFGLLSDNCNLWNIERQNQRLRYNKLKDIYCLNPHTVKCIDDDPLSQAEKSLWNRHFCDQELCAVIKQDVVRTFPGIDFFRKSNIQEIMTSILFCYARQNPIMCYRQGMHEILAPILFVIHSDHQAFMHCQELNNSLYDPILSELLNNKYLEDDSFTIFSYIMTEIESYYRINDLIPTSTGYFPSATNLPATPDEPAACKIEVVDQLNVIRDEILSKEDLLLHNHLIKLDIPLPLFGIRWLRLLFGREFALQDLLILWDAIFAEGDHLHLTNYVVVSMLVMIREKLLSSDYTTCLTLLMKYPNNVDISLIIKLALHMKNPQFYVRPMEYKSFPAITLPRNNVKKQQNKKQMWSTTPTKPLVKKIENHGRRPSLPQTSINININEHEEKPISAKINGIHTLTARAAIKVAAQSHNIGEPDLGIVDGYMENDPEVSIVSIQYAQSIMSISRLKLIQYLTVLRKHTQNITSDEINNALDGIEEICSLLKYTNTNSYNIISAPVDPAFEANEALPKTSASSSSSPPSSSLTKSGGKTPPNDNLSLINKTNTVGKKTKVISDTKIVPESLQNLNVNVDNTKIISTNMKHRYEVPVKDSSRIAERLFGNVKDIEMRVFDIKTKNNDNKVKQTNKYDQNAAPVKYPCKETISISLENN